MIINGSLKLYKQLYVTNNYFNLFHHHHCLDGKAESKVTDKLKNKCRYNTFFITKIYFIFTLFWTNISLVKIILKAIKTILFQRKPICLLYNKQYFKTKMKFKLK